MHDGSIGREKKKKKERISEERYVSLYHLIAQKRE